MVKVDKSKDKNAEVLANAIEYLEEKGFENIKADIEGFETPKSYTRQDTGNAITPDIVAERDGKKHIFEVGLKSEKPRLLKTKWKFFDTLSHMRKQPFKIMTTRGHIRFTKDILESIDLDKKMIRI